MTVSELIKKLQQCNPDAKAMIYQRLFGTHRELHGPIEDSQAVCIDPGNCGCVELEYPIPIVCMANCDC